MRRRKIIYYLLKISLAFPLIYVAISAFQRPSSWIGYIPEFAKGYIPDIQLLNAISVVHIILTSWIILAKKTTIPAVASAIMISAIVAFNLNQIDVLFRDIPIILIAISLAIWDFKK